MKTLPNEVYEQIRRWVYRYGRHLDVTRWWPIKGAIGDLKTLKEHGRLEL